MTLGEIYSLTRPVPTTLAADNKYILLSQGIIETGYLDINDILLKSTPLDSYIKEFGQVLVFPNKCNGEIINLLVRPLNGKAAMLKLGNNALPYNIGNFSKDFKYGDPIILVEGIADLGAIKLLDNTLNVVAMQSASLPREHYDVIASFTNKVIILNDNDKAGNTAKRKMIQTFKEYNITTKFVEQYSGLKDTGEILDKVLLYRRTKNADIQTDIELIKMYYLMQLKVF